MVTRCKSCGAPIIWIRTTNGKSMPCDEEQTYYRYAIHGKGRIVTPSGQVLPCKYMPDEKGADGIGNVPHWVTCTDADLHRKQRSAKTETEIQISMFGGTR